MTNSLQTHTKTPSKLKFAVRLLRNKAVEYVNTIFTEIRAKMTISLQELYTSCFFEVPYVRPHRLSLINNTVVHICCVFFHCDPDLPFEFWAFQLRKHLNGGYQNRPRIF
jgi:hypothetical protein